MINKSTYYIENPRATIIVVHGIAEHSGRYVELAEILNKEGYDVLLYDHLGHGKSSGKRGKLKSFHNNIDVLHDLVLMEKTRTNNKVFLLGHSMGGGVVNIYAVKYGDVDGIISVAAATKTPSNMKALKYTGFWYLRWVRIHTKIFKDDLAINPNIYLTNLEDPLMLDYMYLSLLGEMFIKGVKYLNKNIDKFKVPIIYLHGTSDKIVDYRASVEMMEKIKSTDKELILYDGEYHEILNDFNKTKVYNDIIKWLFKQTNN